MYYQLTLLLLPSFPVLIMREKAISGMMAETHMRDAGVNQRITQLEMVTKQKNDRITQLEMVIEQNDDRITQLEMVIEQIDDRITQLAEKVSLLQQQHENYRDIVIHEADVKQGPLPVSGTTVD